MEIQAFHSYHPEHRNLYKEILMMTLSLRNTYPQYLHWFQSVFIKGLKNGERSYLIARNTRQELIGCALLKHTSTEKKLCTLFVHPLFRRQGIGKALMAETIKILGELPAITVSKENLPQMRPLLTHFGFHLSTVKQNVYRPDSTEFYFNDKAVDHLQTYLVQQKTQQQADLV